MKTIGVPALVLATVLQLFPMLRSAAIFERITSPVFSIIFRWATVSAAVMGSVDAVSGASTLITNPLQVQGTNGVPLSVTSGGRTYAYLPLTTGPEQAHYWTATGLPSGLTLQGTSGSPTWKIFGTPAVAGIFNVGLTAKYVQTSEADRTTTATLVITIVGTATAPTISSQPSPLTVNVGAPASFTVTANGTTPLSYEWSKDGTVIPAATTQTLLFPNVILSDAGIYVVKVSNSAGSISSTSAKLTVNVPAAGPSIVTQPQSQSVHAGESVTFNVTVAGTEPITYQWLLNNAPIPGKTSPSLSLTNVPLAAVGNYSVKVQNSIALITSTPALCSVAGLKISAILPVSNGSKLQWSALPKHGYIIQSRDSLTSGNWVTAGQIQSLLNTIQLEIIVNSMATTGHQFYRLQSIYSP